EEVWTFLNERLHEKLLPIEAYRKKKTPLIKVGALITACLIVLSIIAGFIHPTLCGIFVVATFISVAATGEYLGTVNRKLRIYFKTHILRDLLDYLFEDCTYIPLQRISRSTLEKSLLIAGTVEGVDGEDYMRFRIGETAIHFCETMAYSHSQNTPIFTGVFLSAQFNKSFTSQTVVLPRKLRNKRRFLFSDLKKVELEDPEFRNSFLVYSTDQVESRYILSTSMMTRLLDYRNKTGKDISFSFTGNLLHCAIPSYVNLFEPALFNSFLETGYLQKSLDALRLYTGIVEDLNLNLRIWNKS
ncbi:MAG TPA: DUF3137 domain-containing protein, partial [Bacteroidales bacterium]|nr:DUF3137 domain-containing protein [Bacteroidales bacterium]